MDDTHDRRYAIETRALQKRYHGKRAVNGLDMHVPQGEIYGFVGRNGAGKSTTMKMLCGLAKPSAGDVLLFGCRMGRTPAPETAAATGHGIDALIEGPGILPNLSAYENLMAKAIACGVVNARPRCTELLRVVGLAETGSHRAKGFSLGMKQRLGLAMALLTSPDLLLLDEPFNGLDPEGTRQMRSLLIDLNREKGTTIVVSSHVLDQLDRMASRFGVIRDGRMVREMTAEDVHRACMDSLIVRTTDPARTLVVLEERFETLGFAMRPDHAIAVTGPYDAAAVSTALHEAGQTVLELSTCSRDIEEFFVELMEGRSADGARAEQPGKASVHAHRTGAHARKGGDLHV